MSEAGIEYKAFEHAELSSESYRIRCLLCVLAALMLGLLVRNLASGQLRLLYAQSLALTLALAYEIFALAAVKKALSTQRSVPRPIRYINILVDPGLPTLALFIMIESQLVSPSQALVAPAVFLYFIFIILSTLRLSPGLSLLTGLMSSLGYLAASFHVQQQHPAPDAGSSIIPTFNYIYAGMILAGGIAAAVVAGQIRNHVDAALREAALQRELDRVNEDMDVARSIQQGLLPSHSLSLSGFDVAGWNQPADQTGGDYFDWQMLPDGRLALSLGDATGHGIGPALISASCRAYARASFLSGDQDGLLENLNRLLADDLPQNRFVTFAVAFLDPVRCSVDVLSAGHGPILLYRRATDQIENLDAQGIPLGMISGVRYGHGTKARLAAGDLLAVVTDGFYEWENPEGEEFGLTRLEAVIRESRDCASEEVIARLRSAVECFCKGTEQKDDLTAVILKRNTEQAGAIKSSTVETSTLIQPAIAQAI
ncbi:MAG TPA: PP2C family protein-serine/threonine phosphatase [Blastocatellia bacterium]|nr:PP2C family protein-serine/threonine phosphatase [Blastocatellia bacterium]